MSSPRVHCQMGVPAIMRAMEFFVGDGEHPNQVSWGLDPAGRPLIIWEQFHEDRTPAIFVAMRKLEAECVLEWAKDAKEQAELEGNKKQWGNLTGALEIMIGRMSEVREGTGALN